MFTIGAACAESEPVDLAILAGTGGAPAAGGSTGSGGATSTGGTTGSGGSAGKSGSPGSGGTAGKGGAGGRGGAAGHGGAAGLGGAGAKGGQSGTGGGAGAGGATATFTQVYKTILSMRCSGASCHNPGSQQGFSVSSQANAYNTAQQFIIPGDSYGSTLWEAVDFGDMPRNAARLSDANIALIGAWIDEGAPNN